MDHLARQRVEGTRKSEERPMPTLAISAEDVGFLIVKAREFDVKEANSDPDSGSNATDDNMIDVLEDNGSDPVASEITGFINALSEEEQIDLVALMRLGRGDGTIEEWDDLRREAAEDRNRHTARYLLGQPLLGDYLADGLAAFGLTWVDDEGAAPE
jgi:Protein of unknown function (DUF3775)